MAANSIDELYPTGTPARTGTVTLEEPKGPVTPVAPVTKSLDEMYPTGGPPEATATDALKQVLIGTGQGAVRDAPVVAGGLTGFRLGMPMALAAAPVLGPAAGLIPLATTGIGMTAGYFLGKDVSSLFPAVPREDLVPYREGGITFGSSIAAAPVAFGLPVMTGNRISRFVSALGESARRNPFLYMGAETSAASGAALGGGTAVAYAPDSPGTRMVAEIGGGLLSPGKLLFNATSTATDAVKKVISSVSEGGREQRAANRLLTMLEESGTDIPALLRQLQAPLPPGVSIPTAAQKTGNRGLLELENALARHHARFSGESFEQGKKALDGYQALVFRLKDIGNPEALQAAAKLEEDLFNSMINGRLAAADADAALKISRITVDTPASRRAIGGIVKDETEYALRQAREYESGLWENAIYDLTKGTVIKDDGSTKAYAKFLQTGDTKAYAKSLQTGKVLTSPPRVLPNATQDAFLSRAVNIGDALYEDAIPEAVRKIMKELGVQKADVQTFKTGRQTQEYLDTKKIPGRYGPDLSEIDVGELVNYRSTLLKMARDAAGRGEMGNADFYGAIAQGMLQDLSSLKNPAFDSARQFSKSLNDVFTRTFAKTASVTGDVAKTGAERLSPEILVQRAFGANADVTAQRMEDIEDAVKFMSTQYDQAVATFGKNSAQAKALKPQADIANQKVVSIRDAQSRILRLMANEATDTVFDPATGTYVAKLNTAKLTKFAQQNEAMLEKLNIMPDLRDAAKAAELLKQATSEFSVFNTTKRNQEAFSQVLKFENPTKAIADAINNRFPVKTLGDLTKLAIKGGPDAMNGLKSSLYDYAFTKAGGYDDKFNIKTFDDALFRPLAPNQPSLASIMRDKGLMTFDEVKNLRRLINPMRKVEEALKSNITRDVIVEDSGPIADLAMRVLGAKIGTSASGGGPGSLIAASAGSKAVRYVFDKLPSASIKSVIEQAAKDPQFMAILLKKGRSESEKINIARSLNGYLTAAGLNYQNFEEPPPQQQTLTTPGLAARELLNRLPPAPSTRGMPGAKKPPEATPGGSGGATNPDMFKSLFPFDTIGQMVGQPPKQ